MKNENVSKHYSNEREGRQNAADEIGKGKVLFKCLVDKGHRDGKEWHSITDTGLILIENANTNRFVTTLIARPGQLKRYELGWYGMVERVLNESNEEVKSFHFPEWLYKKAIKHQRDGFNLR